MAPSGKVKPIDPQLHTTEPAYSGKDIALGITFQIAIGEKRSIAVQTHVIRDCDVSELNATFDKIANALDRVNARYRKTELLLLKKQHTEQLGAMMDDYETQMKKHQADWVSRGRRGAFELNGNQISWRSQALNTQERYKKEIQAIDVELGNVEKQIGA